MEMDEDYPECTKEQPLHLNFRALSFLFSVADQADQLLNAVLNQQPIAEISRQLAVDLYELDMSMVGGKEVCSNYAGALLEVNFTHGAFDVATLPGYSKLTEIRLWAEKADPPL